MNRPETDEKAPFTFKLLVEVAAAYLTLRLIQGVVWFIDRLL